MNKFEICVGDNIELIKSDEFFFDKFNPGDVFKITNIKEKELINKYFPGNLTIIFNKKKEVSNLLTANKPTIGVRIPDNKIALAILKSYPYPLATTSANISGNETGTKVEDFIDSFKETVDIVIDQGESKDVPSTIVRVENNEVIVLREGSLKIKKSDI